MKNNTETQITISYTALGDKDAVEVAATTATFDEGSNTITITLAQEAGDATDPGAITATKQDVMEALNSTGKVIATAKDGADLSGLLEATTAVPADTTVTAATHKEAHQRQLILFKLRSKVYLQNAPSSVPTKTGWNTPSTT